MKYVKQIPCFGLFSFLFLWLLKGDLLYHMEQYSLFSFSGDYLVKFFEQPGGLLTLLGAFFTQFCHYPALGALVITLWLCLLAYLVKKTFGLEGKKGLLALVPSVFLLLFITRLDYSIYLQKTYGLLFSQTLGFAAAVALFALYRRRFSGRKTGWLFVLPLIILGYPLIGSFALVAAVLIVLEALRLKKNFVPALASTLVLGAAVPLLCAHLPFIYGRMNRHYAFFMGFPYMEFVDNFLSFLPLVLTFAALAALVFANGLGRKLPVPVFAACALIMLGLTNWDGNFAAVLKMERAVGAQDWDTVLKVAAKRQNPTRIQVLYRNIALYAKGELTEKMFTYPDGAAPLKTTADVPVSMVCSVPVQYWCGMINSSERSAMEFSSSFCRSVFYSKYQAMTALIKGDYEIALKYMDAIEGSWFQGKWLRKYKYFLENPATMASEDEFTRLYPIMDFDGQPADLATSLESSMNHYFDHLDYENENLYEWQMAQLMMQKNETYFCQLFFDRYEKRPQAPVTKGIAEAAALFGGTSGDSRTMVRIGDAMASRQDVLKQFSPFANSMNMVSDLDNPSTIERFRNRYGDTYWFYYFFVNDIY